MIGEIEFEKDIFARSDWPLFANSGIKNQDVGMIVVRIPLPVTISDRSQFWLSDQIELLLHTLVAQDSLKLSAYIVNDHERPKTAISKYRKIWRAPELQPLPEGLDLTEEVEFNCQNGLKYASVCSLKREHIRWLAETIPRTAFTIPIVSEKVLPPAIDIARVFTRAAFPPDGCGKGPLPDNFDWPRFASICVEFGAHFLRHPKFFFEGNRCQFDVIGETRSLRRIYNSMVLS
jgi:hypothetical protein